MEFTSEGFLKITAPPRAELEPGKKSALRRKGNELFNAGEVELAKKIFLTLGYTDGIIRAGDYHYKKGDFLEAFRLYKIAPAPAKVDFLLEAMAGIVRQWIQE